MTTTQPAGAQSKTRMEWIAEQMAENGMVTQAREVLAMEAALAEAQRRAADETAIVDRIWDQFGRPSYEELNGRSIYDLISEVKMRSDIYLEICSRFKIERGKGVIRYIERMEKSLKEIREQAEAGCFVEHDCPAMFACSAIVVELDALSSTGAAETSTTKGLGE